MTPNTWRVLTKLNTKLLLDSQSYVLTRHSTLEGAHFSFIPSSESRQEGTETVSSIHGCLERFLCEIFTTF